MGGCKCVPCACPTSFQGRPNRSLQHCCPAPVACSLLPSHVQVQCVAALDTACIFLGWLVPTYFALRRHHDAAWHRRQQQLQQRRQRPGLQRGLAPAPAGVIPASPPLDGPGGSDGHLAPPAGDHSTRSRRLLGLPSADAVVAWILENLFLRNALLVETTVLAWWVLAALCWIGGGLLALLSLR